MDLKGGFFDSSDDDRLYSAADFAKCFSNYIKNGIVKGGDGLGFKVTEKIGQDLKVGVNPGRAWINGYWCDNEEEVVVSIPTNTTFSFLNYSIVLRLDVNNGRKFSIEVIASETEGAMPSLVRGDGIYDLNLAYVTVKKNATTINAINDTRSIPSLCGWSRSIIEMDKDELDSVLTYWNNNANQSYNVFIEQMEAYKQQLEGIIGEETAGQLLNKINELQTSKQDKLNLSGSGVVYYDSEQGYQSKPIETLVKTAGIFHAVKVSKIGVSAGENSFKLVKSSLPQALQNPKNYEIVSASITIDDSEKQFYPAYIPGSASTPDEFLRVNTDVSGNITINFSTGRRNASYKVEIVLVCIDLASVQQH